MQQAYLKASNAGAGDEFDTRSPYPATPGDRGHRRSRRRAFRGQRQDLRFDPRSGAAYVFVREGTTWTERAYLKASNTDAHDRFGWSVAVEGDTVVVGAYGEDSAATGVGGFQADNSVANSGAAYIFVREGDGWSQRAFLKASNTGAGDNFGWSVAVSGDTVVVGAREEASAATGVNGNQSDDSATDAGAAYVFVRDGDTGSQQAYLKASNTGRGDFFGYAVDVSADTVVVGAPGEAGSATGIDGNHADDGSAAGAAYVFVRDGSSWSQQAYLKASNTGAGDRFGYSVAVSGDTVILGAPTEPGSAAGVNGNGADDGTFESGATYLFTRHGGAWTQRAYVKASNTGAADWYGYAVALSGDTLATGAYREGSAATGVNGSRADDSAPLVRRRLPVPVLSHPDGSGFAHDSEIMEFDPCAADVPGNIASRLDDDHDGT
ncbi:MAG: FG-GAP repeat protein [Gammaproteobacteria bacterium]|nr:FG-GAP repeat protein [Gammaproteobacteria bacterium]